MAIVASLRRSAHDHRNQRSRSRNRRSPSAEYARGFISKVYHADPLVCRGCGGPLKIVAYITDELSIRRILDHLGLSPPEEAKPPPPREVARVPVDDEGREIQAR